MEKVEGNRLEAIDNPEWLKVEVDSVQHILHGIKRDGTIEWTTGELSPEQICALKKRIAELGRNKDGK